MAKNIKYYMLFFLISLISLFSQSLGVETSDDFQFFEESDLIMALRPIQARKVLDAWKMRCKYSSILGCS